MPQLREDPWSRLQPGALAVSVRQPLATFYDIHGDFTLGNDSIGFEHPSDSGKIEGKYGLSSRIDVMLTERLSFATGLDFRTYDVVGLNPTESALTPLPVAVDPVSSLQVYTALRYFLPPFAGHPRWRPFLQGTIAYLPWTDLDLQVTIPGSSDLAIGSTSGDFLLLGLMGGMAYQWSDSRVFEFGLLYETALTSMFTDLSTELVGVPILFTGELEPRGYILFVGLTWYF